MTFLLDYTNQEEMRQLALAVEIGTILHWRCSGVSTYGKVLRKLPCGCVHVQTCLEDGTPYPDVPDNIWNLGCNCGCDHKEE